MFTLFETPNDRLLLLIVVYVFYLFFGALIFDALESPHEAKIIRELNAYVHAFAAGPLRCYCM